MLIIIIKIKKYIHPFLKYIFNELNNIFFHISNRPKRKVIKKLNGSKLLMYIEKFDSSYQQLLKDNPNQNINELRQFHKELTMGVLETWGHQQLGLDVKHPFISKEIKRDVKKGSDRSLTLVYGWFGKKLSIENEEKEFSKGCDISTIEVTESITTDEDIKEMIPSIPDHMIPDLKKYGKNTWSFS